MNFGHVGRLVLVGEVFNIKLPENVVFNVIK